MIKDRIVEISSERRGLLPVRCAGRRESYSSNDLKKILDNDQRSLLITGDTGTGKGMLADCVEQSSKRRTVRFHRINGADIDSQGLLRACDGGVLFLDDICSLSTDVQFRLARFMKDVNKRSYVRIVAETNKDVNDDTVMIPDLRERFDFEVKLPPLRERGGDILWFVGEPDFLGSGEVFKGITLRTLVGILMHDWSGNILELKKYCRQKETLHPVSHTDVRRYVCDDTDIFYRWSEPATSFAGFALLAFESYARKSAGGVPPGAKRVAALFAGLFYGMQGLLRGGDENVAVLPLAQLHDLINRMLPERADFDLASAFFGAVMSYDTQVASILEELNFNGVGSRKLDFAAALNRIVHVAFSADAELCARGWVDFRDRIPTTFCKAYRNPNSFLPKGEVLFSMPPPPNSDCGQVSVLDEPGAGMNGCLCGCNAIPGEIMGEDKKLVAGTLFIGGPLSIRWAHALAYGHTGAEVEWKTLFPELPEVTWKRYFVKVRKTVCERRDFDNGGLFLTPARWQSEYEAFAKAVLESEKAPKLKVPEPMADMHFLRIDYGRFFEDIAKSADMIPDVVGLGSIFWKIGQVRVAKKMDTHPVVRFVGKLDSNNRQALADCAGGKFPGGVLVPSTEELPSADFDWLRKYGFAVFGVVEDCRLGNAGVFEVRDPKAWVMALEPQIHPGVLREARSVGNTYRRHVADVADSSESNESTEERPSKSPVVMVRTIIKPKAVANERVCKPVEYPRKVGRLRVLDENWRDVKLDEDLVSLSPEMKSVLQAMDELGATDETYPATRAAIFKKAGIKNGKKTISNIFTSRGDKKSASVYRDYYTALIANVSKNGTTGRYYLLQ